jgi:hypothetical protein
MKWRQRHLHQSQHRLRLRLTQSLHRLHLHLTQSLLRRRPFEKNLKWSKNPRSKNP